MGGSGSGGRRNGSGSWGGGSASGSAGGGSGAPRGEGGGGGGGGGERQRDPTRKQVWKLVEGRPKIAFIKVGLTDGSSTQLLDGELQPGDQLITEIQGLAAPKRKMGAF